MRNILSDNKLDGHKKSANREGVSISSFVSACRFQSRIASLRRNPCYPQVRIC